MACKSCAQKQQAMTYLRAIQPVVQVELPCKYTLEELFEMRVLSIQNNDELKTALINSAINSYAKNCNKYSERL